MEVYSLDRNNYFGCPSSPNLIW